MIRPNYSEDLHSQGYTFSEIMDCLRILSLGNLNVSLHMKEDNILHALHHVVPFNKLLTQEDMSQWKTSGFTVQEEKHL